MTVEERLLPAAGSLVSPTRYLASMMEGECSPTVLLAGTRPDSKPGDGSLKVVRRCRVKRTSWAWSGGEFLPLLVVLALAALVYGLYGFDGPLYRDYGIYLYGGQRMAEGIPPY